jgi:small nuclear ribonucleoprotein (snRNP)-like protein
MSAAVVAPKKQKATVLPINVMYRFLQAVRCDSFGLYTLFCCISPALTLLTRSLALHSQKSRVRIWLVEHTDMYMEGVLIGFDEFMNVVLDNANEVRSFALFLSCLKHLPARLSPRSLPSPRVFLCPSP